MISQVHERSSIDRHFAGSARPDEERRMRLHVLECEVCRRYYDRHVLLSKLDPKALGRRERIGRGLGLRPTISARAFRFGAAAAIVGAAALALIVLEGPELAREDPTGGFRARAGATSATSAIFVYRFDRGAPVAVGTSTAPGRIARRSELAFAYENPLGLGRLLVFGVDEHRHVYWYHPAWVSTEEAPTAIPIRTDPGRHELREAVRHELDGARLTVFGVFTDQPIGVKAVEEAVARWRPESDGHSLPLGGSARASAVVLEVEK